MNQSKDLFFFEKAESGRKIGKAHTEMGGR
jgi:hypothetical protein